MTKEKKGTMRVIPAGKKKCVWMEAGVVSYKLCDNNYDCPTCPYDHAMQVKASRRSQTAVAAEVEKAPERFPATWVEKMMRLPADRRKCRYMITGEVDQKICPNAYECGTCSFDRMMQQRLRGQALGAQVSREVVGFQLAEGFYYHEGHTWARPEYGGRVRVGLDDFIQKVLGRLSAVEVPDVGRELRQGEVGFVIRRNGDVASVLSPVHGVVVQVNYKAVGQPEIIHASPHEEGWLCIIEPTRLRKDLKGLYYGEEAEVFLREERERLLAMDDGVFRAAADGGVPVQDVVREMEGVRWTELARRFLRT